MPVETKSNKIWLVHCMSFLFYSSSYSFLYCWIMLSAIDRPEILTNLIQQAAQLV